MDRSNRKNNACVIPPKIVNYPPYELWDFVSPRGENLMRRWADAEKLSKADRARLDNKIAVLKRDDFSLAINTKLLNGPIRKEIYKLKVYGQVMMRPLLCRGPIDKPAEYTFLVGAIERNGNLEPSSCLNDAAANRETVITDSKRRCNHEQFA
jgi:hypothetical protein